MSKNCEHWQIRFEEKNEVWVCRLCGKVFHKTADIEKLLRHQIELKERELENFMLSEIRAYNAKICSDYSKASVKDLTAIKEVLEETEE